MREKNILLQVSNNWHNFIIELFPWPAVGAEGAWLLEEQTMDTLLQDATFTSTGRPDKTPLT